MRGHWTTVKPTKPGWYKVYSGSEVEFALIEHESEAMREKRLESPDLYPDDLDEGPELVLWLIAKEDEIYLSEIGEGSWWSQAEELPDKPSEVK
jgi:hypothetical protein